MNKHKFPPVPQVLLETLEAHFKNTLPTDMTTSLETLRYLQGQQQMIQFLRVKFNRQAEE